MMISRKEFLGMIAVAGAGWPAISAFGNNKPKGPTRFTLSTKRLLLRHTWTISRNSSDFKDNVFVRIEREGVVGWGEAAPNVRYGESAEKTLAVLRNARGLFESSDWFRYVDMRKEWEGIIKDQRCGGAALDMAILDWVGQKLNVPFYNLLGLDERKTATTSFSIGIDSPEIVQQKVREAGDYPILKIKVGRGSDKEMLKAVRDVTDKPLYVDANEAWRDKRVALDKINWLQGLGVKLIEQPLPAEMIEQTAWLRKQVHIPIVADEAVKRASDISKLAGAYDGINIKLMKAGGIQEAIRMIHVARAFGMKVMLGCMIESSLAISAAAHLSPLADYVDLDGNLLVSNDPFTGVSVKHGKLILNDRPGFGVSERPLQ